MASLQALINRISQLAVDTGNALQLRGFKPGGTTGQIPVKNSNDDFDWSWGNDSSTWSGLPDKPAWTATFNGSYSSLSGTPTLGGAAALNVGTTAGTVAAGDHQHGSADITDATALSTPNTIAKRDSSGICDFSTVKITSGSFKASFGSGAPISQNRAYVAPNADGYIALTAATTGVPDNINPGSAKTTPIDADEVIMRDSTGTPVAKRLTFANLWTWIQSKLDGVLTIAGAKTLTGQLELTGQTATNPTSAMTRGLGDARYGQIRLGVKQQNEERSNTTTLASDADLRVAVDANATYYVELFLPYWTLDSSATQGINVSLSGPSGWTFEGSADIVISGAFSTAGRRFINTSERGIGNGNLSGESCVRIRGAAFVASTAGEIVVNWAQFASSSARTRVPKGAFISAIRKY